MTRTENFFPDEFYKEIENKNFVFVGQSTHRSNGVVFQYKETDVYYYLEEGIRGELEIDIRPWGKFSKGDMIKMENFMETIIEKIKEDKKEIYI